MSIQDYVRKHRVLRALMISADFPHMANETTTVKFMVEGLRPNPKFSDPIRIFKAFGCPGTITAFEHRLIDIESENMKSDPTPKHRPQGALMDQPHSGYRAAGVAAVALVTVDADDMDSTAIASPSTFNN